MWKIIRDDNAGEFTTLLQQDTSYTKVFRLTIAGFEEDERITKILDKSSMEEAARSYIEYRENLRNQGISSLISLDPEVITHCPGCELIKESNWWQYCPRCGTKFAE